MANKFGRGFSFLELLVSIGIFAVITTAVVVNFRSGQHSNELRLAAQQLASDLQSLYTQAQAGSEGKVVITNGTITKNGIPMPFPSAITLDHTLALTITFTPPEPQITINQQTITGIDTPDMAVLTLQHTKTNQTKTVVIKRISGRITTE